MDDWLEIFEGNAAAARDLASELHTQGIRAFVDDRRGPIVTTHGGRATSSVVLVQPSDSERAQDAANRWEEANSRQARSLTARLYRILGLSLLPPVIWVLGHWLAPHVFPELNLGWLFGLFLVLLAGLTQIDYRRNRAKAPPAA